MMLTDAEVIALATLIATPLDRVGEALKAQEIAATVHRLQQTAEHIIHESRSTRR